MHPRSMAMVVPNPHHIGDTQNRKENAATRLTSKDRSQHGYRHHTGAMDSGLGHAIQDGDYLYEKKVDETELVRKKIDQNLFGWG